MDPCLKYSEAEAEALAHVQATLACLSQAHRLEVGRLRKEVQELTDALRRAGGTEFDRQEESTGEPPLDTPSANQGSSVPSVADVPPGLPSTGRDSTVERVTTYAASAAARGSVGGTTMSKTASASKTSQRLSAMSAREVAATPSRPRMFPSTIFRRMTGQTPEKKADDMVRDCQKSQSLTVRTFNSMMRETTSLSSNAVRAVGFPNDHARRGLRAVVEHPLFDSLCAMVIILNSVLIGIDVEWKTLHDESQLWLEHTANACSLFFLAELLLRVRVYRWQFFYGSESYQWNLFDTLLVLFSLFDFFTSTVFRQDASPSAGMSLKAAKMLRIVRVFRVFRFFRELTLLAMMVIDSLKSLVWAVVMLSIILYVFAIIFTQLSTDFIKSNGQSMAGTPGMSEVQRQFGTLPSTVYVLLQSMLGGVSWGVASDALLQIHWVSTFLFFFYIFFTMLAFLNVTTGVFVDHAVELGRTQRDYLVQKELQLKEKYMREMRDLFMAIDEDGSGSVTQDEVEAYFEDRRMQSYFAALGINAADTGRLFSLLDNDGDGHLSIDEFLEGCMRLRGQASSIDVQHLHMDVKKVKRLLEMTTDMRSLGNSVFSVNPALLKSASRGPLHEVQRQQEQEEEGVQGEPAQRARQAEPSALKGASRGEAQEDRAGREVEDEREVDELARRVGCAQDLDAEFLSF